MDKETKPGLYRHYRGPIYWVIGEAINTTNDAHDERMVLYVNQEDKDKPGVVPFTRRKTEFFEVVDWPDGFPRPRWTHEDTFKPKEPRRSVWIGAMTLTLINVDDDIDSLLCGETSIRWASWRSLEHYLEDVLDPVWPRPYSSSRDAYLPLPSDGLLAPLFDNDRDAMIAEVRRRIGDVGFVLVGNPGLADLPALKAFVARLSPLADEENRKGRRARGCF